MKQKKWMMRNKMRMVEKMMTTMMKAPILIWTNMVMKIVRTLMKSLNFQVRTR